MVRLVCVVWCCWSVVARRVAVCLRCFVLFCFVLFGVKFVFVCLVFDVFVVPCVYVGVVVVF